MLPRSAITRPWSNLGKLFGFAGKQLHARLTTPEVPVHSRDLRGEAGELGKRVREFGLAVQNMLFRYREGVLERQYIHERIADAACDLYASACTLSRLDHILTTGNGNQEEVKRDASAGRYFLKLADRRIRQSLAALGDNDDDDTTAAANAALEKS